MAILSDFHSANRSAKLCILNRVSIKRGLRINGSQIKIFVEKKNLDLIIFITKKIIKNLALNTRTRAYRYIVWARSYLLANLQVLF